MGAKNSDNGTETAVEVDGLTHAQAAELAGCSVKSIQRAIKGGRLPSVLTREAVMRFADADLSIEMAKADAVGALVSSATQGQRDAYEQARLMLEASRKASADIIEGLQQAVTARDARIRELEDRIDKYNEVIEALNKSRYDLEQAKADAEVRKKQGAAAIEVGKSLAPAIIARILGGEELNQGAFKGFVDSLNDEQRDKIFASLGPILDDQQRMVIMTLLSGWAARAEEKKEAPPASANGASASEKSAD